MLQAAGTLILRNVPYAHNFQSVASNTAITPRALLQDDSRGMDIFTISGVPSNQCRQSIPGRNYSRHFSSNWLNMCIVFVAKWTAGSDFIITEHFDVVKKGKGEHLFKRPK